MEEGCSEYLGYLILGLTIIPRKEEERDTVNVSIVYNKKQLVLGPP